MKLLLDEVVTSLVTLISVPPFNYSRGNSVIDYSGAPIQETSTEKLMEDERYLVLSDNETK